MCRIDFVTAFVSDRSGAGVHVSYMYCVLLIVSVTVVQIEGSASSMLMSYDQRFRGRARRRDAKDRKREEILSERCICCSGRCVVFGQYAVG